MSPQQLREKNPKVEGRDPPEPGKETIAPFESLTARLLKVPMSEMKEQQALYEKAQENPQLAGKKRRKLGLSGATPFVGPKTQSKEKNQIS